MRVTIAKCWRLIGLSLLRRQHISEAFLAGTFILSIAVAKAGEQGKVCDSTYVHTPYRLRRAGRRADAGQIGSTKWPRTCAALSTETAKPLN